VEWGLKNQANLRPKGKRLAFRVRGGDGGGLISTVNTEYTYCWPHSVRHQNPF